MNMKDLAVHRRHFDAAPKGSDAEFDAIRDIQNLLAAAEEQGADNVKIDILAGMQEATQVIEERP